MEHSKRVKGKSYHSYDMIFVMLLKDDQDLGEV